MRVAIVGSGIAGAIMAYELTQRGHEVTIFEKGKKYPYPHAQVMQERIFLGYDNPDYELPPAIKTVEVEGYGWDINLERALREGGSATTWVGITHRMHPEDFRTQSLFGFGMDWPVSYDELEPYYVQAERLLQVSGTDDDNPFATPRSAPYPLPHFELPYHERLLAERLADNGITIATTPQARTREAADGRPACQNFGVCPFCPIGVRYSPHHHLNLAAATGLCTVITEATVRRFEVDSQGRARALYYRHPYSGMDQEHVADVFFVAAGGIETPRLLLLSTNSNYPDGLGNQGGQVGRNLVFHHVWRGDIGHDSIPIHTRRQGPIGAHSQQFVNPATRGEHGGIKIEFSSNSGIGGLLATNLDELQRTQERFEERMARQPIGMHSESVASDEKYVTLARKTDRYGDPFPRVVYYSNAFDEATYGYARQLYDQFVAASGGIAHGFAEDLEDYDSGAHHMAACRMGTSPDDSVVDGFGRVHGISNVFVGGLPVVTGTTGAINPTLTLTALTIRSAEYIDDQLG